jgi:L-aspartate oxidase
MSPSSQNPVPILIIGSGIAGLSTAIALAQRGTHSLIITAASDLPETNTVYAQGGIIYQADDPQKDSFELENDILKAGGEINYLPAIKQLVQDGPKLVEEVLLKRAHVPFDKDENQNNYHLTREGGHSATRIIHRADESGKAIEEALLAYAKTLPQIRFETGATAINLLMTSFHSLDRSVRHDQARCFGAFVYFHKPKKVEPVFSYHTVLATGGIGQLFLHSTNGKFSRGDGIALAHRAGCRLENLEYVQFHPTTFYQTGGPRFLISEALRGEGAYIINQKGERFLTHRLPDFEIPELAPRDKVAQAIHEEMLSSGAPCVFLDISHKPKAWIQERFPFIYKSCLKFGVDMTAQPIPVVPGAHYHCGGVWTDLSGQTSVPHLWASGEVACTGLHGANRLASNSLLEALVYAHRAAIDSIESIKNNSFCEGLPEWNAEGTTSPEEMVLITQSLQELRGIMTNYVGIVRSDLRLKRAFDRLKILHTETEDLYERSTVSSDLCELRNMIKVGYIVIKQAMQRKESIGLHYNIDYLTQNTH